MSAILHPSLSKNTTLHRNSLGYSRVIFSSVFPHLVRISSGRSWASALRCDLHTPASNQMIDGTEKPKSLPSSQNAQRDTTNSAVKQSLLLTSIVGKANKKTNRFTPARTLYSLQIELPLCAISRS